MLLQRSFKFTGYKPVYECLKYVNKDAAQFFGIQAAFVVSGLMHEIGLISAAPAHVRDSHSWATICFFPLHGIAYALEAMYERATGRKVGGMVGRVWSLTFICVTGSWLTHDWQVFLLAF